MEFSEGSERKSPTTTKPNLLAIGDCYDRMETPVIYHVALTKDCH